MTLTRGIVYIRNKKSSQIKENERELLHQTGGIITW